MANKQKDMRKIKRIYKLYTSGVSKRRISKQLGIFRNTIAKYIYFVKQYRLTNMTLKELYSLFKDDQKP